MLSGPFARNVATRCEHTTTTTSSTTTSTNTRHRHYHHYHRSRNMASSHPAIQLQQHSQGLPSITSLTNDLPKPAAPISPEGQSLTDSGRDSGTWPQPQSKRKSPTTTTPTPNPAHMAHCYWKTTLVVAISRDVFAWRQRSVHPWSRHLVATCPALHLRKYMYRWIPKLTPSPQIILPTAKDCKCIRC